MGQSVSSSPRAGEPTQRRCRPCAVANLTAGLLAAVLPLLAAIGGGDRAAVAVAAAWGASVALYTLHRVTSRGYLPGADVAARLLGLDRVLGAGAATRPRPTTGGPHHGDH